MVACPKCGKDNPPHYKRCFWCGEDITEAVLHWLEHLSEPIIPMELPRKQKLPRIKTGSYATFGYFLLAMSVCVLIAVPVQFAWIPMLLGLVGIFSLSGFWMWFEKRFGEEDGMLFGIFSLSIMLLNFTILTTLTAAIIGIDFGTFDVWLVRFGFSSYFIISILSLWLIVDFADNTNFKTIAEIILGLNILGLAGFLFLDFFVWVFLIAMTSGFVFLLWLHSEILISAGKKVESQIIRISGWIVKCVAALSVVVICLILVLRGHLKIFEDLWMGSGIVQRISVTGPTNLIIFIQIVVCSIGYIVAGIGFLKAKEKPTSPSGPIFIPRELEGSLRDKVKIIGVTVVVAALLGTFGANFYIQRNYPWILFPSEKLAVGTSGVIEDKIIGAGENYLNGKLRLQITLLKGYLDDVFDSTQPLRIRFMGANGSWVGESISFSSWGTLEEFYGGTVELDGIMDIPEASDNIYVVVSVPVTSTGDVAEGSTITVEMWPTQNNATSFDSTISSATFDENCEDNLWNVGDRLGLFITGKNHIVTLLGEDGVLLGSSEK